MSRPMRSLPRPLLRQTLRTPAIRHASRYASQSVPRRFLSTTILLGGTAALVAYYYDSRSALHEHVAMPLIRLLADPETGHKLSIKLLAAPSWMRPRDRGVDGEELQTELFGMKLKNPVGMAAGLDKDGEAIDGLFDLGFGYVEVGSVTPEPQPGNPKPRFFRLEEDDAAINRYGFNSLGHGHTLQQLRSRVFVFSKEHPEYFPTLSNSIPLPPSNLPRSLRPGHLLAVNLGKNKTSPADSNEDYIKGVRMLGPYADVVVINVSSPNTPGLRALQGKEMLAKLLKDVVEERDRIAVGGLPKIAVKVACDLNEEELGDVAGAVRSSGVEGVIVSNTTIRRDGLGLKSSNQSQIGGLSGKPLFPLSLIALQTLRPLLPPSIPIIGCGGISTGEDALTMAKAGASLVQLYTSFGYRGVGTPRLIKDEITSSLQSSKSTWKSSIGSSWNDSQMGWKGEEEQFKKTSEQLRKEAEGLGEMLKNLRNKEDTASLVRKAEEALGKFKSPTPQPRDNLLGSINEGNMPAIEQTTSQPTGASERTITSGNVGGVPAGLETVLPTEAADLAPIVVEEIPPPHQPEVDEWTQTVREGQRRLV